MITWSSFPIQIWAPYWSGECSTIIKDHTHLHLRGVPVLHIETNREGNMWVRQEIQTRSNHSLQTNVAKAGSCQFWWWTGGGSSCTQERVQGRTMSVLQFLCLPVVRLSAFTVWSEGWRDLAVKKVSARFVLPGLTLTLHKMRLNGSLGL